MSKRRHSGDGDGSSSSSSSAVDATHSNASGSGGGSACHDAEDGSHKRQKPTDGCSTNGSNGSTPSLAVACEALASAVATALASTDKVLLLPSLAHVMQELNSALVELLREQLTVRPSHDFSDVMRQYLRHIQEIHSTLYSSQSPSSSPSLIRSPLESSESTVGASGPGAHMPIEEIRTSTTLKSTTQPAKPSQYDDGEKNASVSTYRKPPQASSSFEFLITGDLPPASPDPFLNGFSHSLPLEDEDDDEQLDREHGNVFTRETEYEFQAQMSLSLGMDGFLAVNKCVGVWNEPVLHQKRIPSEQLTCNKLLSTGGDFGDVLLGELRGQRVAIKRLSSNNDCNSNSRKATALAFASEITVMSELLHPAIAAFVGVEWTREWEAQAVAEYVEHGDLRTLLSSSSPSSGLSWEDFKCHVALDVADALVYLQQRSPQVVMELLKARNVLVAGTDGRCKLSVFAVARMRSVTDCSTNSSSTGMEASRWLAPEIIRGDPKTHASLIYSFGVLLCELDTHAVPFSDALDPDGSPMSSYKIAQFVTSGKLRPSLSVDCPEQIALLARQCMAHEPQQRPTVASVAYRLRAIRKNEL